MKRLMQFSKAAMIMVGVALGALASSPAALAFGGGHFGGGGFHGGGFGGFGGMRGGGFGGFHGGGVGAFHGGVGAFHGGVGAFHGGRFGGVHGGGFYGGRFGRGYGGYGGYGGYAGYPGYGYGGWGWGLPVVPFLGWSYDPYYGDYGDDVAACTLRRVHVHTVHGWLWRTYEYC